MADVSFPFRGEDLPVGAFWFKGANDRWDFRARRRTSSGGWDPIEANPNNPEQNDEWVGYGIPVYAVTEGEVVASWRNAPENPRPGMSHDGRLATPKTIPRSGNFVMVLGSDGRVILYAHLVTNTVPEGLCSAKARSEEFVENADDRVIADGTNVSAPRETLLPTGNRPRVSRGQFLGRVGNSGASGNPHLHIQRWDAAGSADEFTFDRAWMSDANRPTDWRPFTGQGVSASQTDLVILASPLLRRGEASAGGFGELVMHFVRSRRLVTALSGENGDLKLICWALTPAEQILRRGDTSAGRASRIAIAEPRSDLVVTALRDGNGNLRLISWRVESDGNFTRCADDSAGAVSRVALGAPDEGVVVAAVRAASGNLKLIAWSVAPNGDFTRRGEADAGAISDVKLATTRVFAGFVTALRLASGTLKLIAWRVSDTGNTITRLGDAEAGGAEDFAVVSRGNNRQFLLTPLRDADGDFRLIAWQIAAEGGSIARLTTGVAGAVDEVEIAGAPGSNLSAVVACRDNSGLLRLMTWELSSDGETLTRSGGGLAGGASKISIAGTSDSGRDFFVTTCATSSGDVKLINWEANTSG